MNSRVTPIALYMLQSDIHNMRDTSWRLGVKDHHQPLPFKGLQLELGLHSVVYRTFRISFTSWSSLFLTNLINTSRTLTTCWYVEWEPSPAGHWQWLLRTSPAEGTIFVLHSSFFISATRRYLIWSTLLKEAQWQPGSVTPLHCTVYSEQCITVT